MGFFYFSLGLLAIEKDSKRNVQCSVVFSPFLVLHAVVFYFSYGLDISKFYRIRRENSCVLGVNSPYLGFQILIHIIFNWGAWNNLKPEQMLHLMFLFGWGFLVYFDLLLKIQNSGEISARKKSLMKDCFGNLKIWIIYDVLLTNLEHLATFSCMSDQMTFNGRSQNIVTYAK